MALKLGFDADAAVFDTQVHNARVWSEGWVARELYCLNCGGPRLAKLPNNNPVGDFACIRCAEEYEIKSCAGKFGSKVVDGAYKSMMMRLAANNNPSLVLLGYDRAKKAVSNLAVVPKHFSWPMLCRNARRSLRAPGAQDGSDATSC